MKIRTIVLLCGSSSALACGGEAGPIEGEVGSVSQASTMTFPISVSASEDATIRDGTFADENFGNDTTLGVKKAATNFNRESLLKFDISTFNNSSFTSTGPIRLQLFGALNQPDNIHVRVVGDLPTWTESTVTWNTKHQPPLVALVVYDDTVNVTSTSNHWWTWNVDAAVRDALAKGLNVFAVKLQSTTTSSTVVSFKSSEAGSNVAPRLVSTRTTTTPDAIATGGCATDPRVGTTCTGTIPSTRCTTGFTGTTTGKYICDGSNIVCDVKFGRDYCATCGVGCGDCFGNTCVDDQDCSPDAVCNTYPGQGYCGKSCDLKAGFCWKPGTRPADTVACSL